MFRLSTIMLLIMSIMCVHLYADPYPTDELTPLYQQAANYIISQSGMDAKGYCIVYGAGEGRLAYEMSLLSSMRFFGADGDAGKIAQGRTILTGEKVYGSRIILHQKDLTDLTYSDYSGQLVVSDYIIENGSCPGTAAEMFRMVRPDGGIAIIGQPSGCPNVLTRSELENWLDAASLTYTITEDSNGLWARIDRGPLPGAGEWSRMYGNLGNTACSGDEIISVNIQPLWFGDPPGQISVNRHNRHMSPVYRRGRLFIPGIHSVTCLDAYNGAKLWELYVPDSSRIAIDQDCGWIEAIHDYVYVVAKDDCYKIDAYKRTTLDTFHPPTGSGDWGYLGCVDNMVFGSEQIANASVIGSTSDFWSASHGGHKDHVVSRRFFCLNADTGSTIWTYDENSVIVNGCICISEDAVYFYESYNSSAVNDSNGRVQPSTLSSSAHLVKLNRANGNLVWRISLASMPFEHSMYLSYSDGMLLLSGASDNGSRIWYHNYVYNTSTQSLVWSQDIGGPSDVNNSHGYQDKHPIINGNSIFTKFGSRDLLTGANLYWGWDTSNCTDTTASKYYLFTRGQASQGNLYMKPFPGSPGDTQAVNRWVRPGCFMEVITAGGLIMMPSSGEQCDCDFPLQTTFGWQSK